MVTVDVMLSNGFIVSMLPVKKESSGSEFPPIFHVA